MHPYSFIKGNQADEKISSFYRIAFCSITVGAIIYYTTKVYIDPLLLRYPEMTPLIHLCSFISGVPSTLAIYYLFHKLTDVYFWKKNVVRFFFNITVPNINGEWIGIAKIYDREGGTSESRPVKLCIQQSWGSLGISLLASKHISESRGASIRTAPNGYVVFYNYEATKKYKFSDISNIDHHHSHVGAARLYIPIIKGNTYLDIIKLQFYTEDLLRGSIHLKKVEDYYEGVKCEMKELDEILEPILRERRKSEIG